MLTLAFTAPGPFDPGPNAEIEGTMLATATNIGLPAPGGSDLCTALELHAAYKSGPRPILSPAGDLGDPPLEALPQAQLQCGADDGAGNLPYRIVGLSSLLPNRVDLSSFKECNEYIESRVDVVQANGDPLGFILSPDFAQPLDLTATASSELCAKDSPDPGKPEIPKDEDSCPMCGPSLPGDWRGLPPSLPPIELPQLQLRM